ncbi:MAG: hypothetical protein ACLQUY_10115 [Ktedonobacterales bacterium]
MQIAAEYGVHPTQPITGRATALDGLPCLVARQDSTLTVKADDEARLAALYEEIGRLSTPVTRQSGLDPVGT